MKRDKSKTIASLKNLIEHPKTPKNERAAANKALDRVTGTAPAPKAKPVVRRPRKASPAETKAAPVETAQPAAETKPVRESSKTAILVSLMQRPGGATLAELMTAANWQAHSVRGFVAGTLKKMGFEAVSTKTDGVRRYEVKA